jgi:hypothetical protein
VFHDTSHGEFVECHPSPVSGHIIFSKLKTNNLSLNSSSSFVYHGTGHDEFHMVHPLRVH